MTVTPRETTEYRELRATIRTRGTARLWIALTSFLGWAALALLAAALGVAPALTLVPLLVLVVAYEIVFSVHTAVERVGRYVQVFFEEEGEDEGEEAGYGWEHYAMAYAQRFPRSAPDPLLTGVFIAASLLNFMTVGVLGGVAVEYWSLGVVHLLFVIRVLVGRRQAGRQRALDLQRFRELKRS
jgi:hypothetical protein